MEHELPRGWASAKVSEVADVIEPGFPYGKYNTNGEGFPHLRPMNINGQGRLCLDEVKYVNVDNPPFLQSGDILFNNTNSPVWVGKTTVISQGNEFTFSNHMTRLKLNVYAGTPAFFAFQLQYMQQKGYFMERCVHHVNQASIASNYLANNVDLLVAPLPEQSRIVSAIEQQFSRLDVAVASLQSAKIKLKRYRASILKSAVEGKLTEEWRAQHPDIEPASSLLQRILQERRARWEADQLAKMQARSVVPKDDAWKKAYKEPAAPDVESLPDLPEGWCWATFEQVSERVTVGHVGSMKNEYVDSGIPFLRSQNVRPNQFDSEGLKFISDKFHQQLAKSALESGDLLVVRSGSVGVACVMPNLYKKANCSDLVIVKKPIGIDANYAAYYMNSTAQDRVRARQVGIALIHFNTHSMAAMPLPLPPLEEQTQIVSEVEQYLSIISETEATIDADLKRAERERQSILEAAFSGRLVPQEPDDEPASVLLARIREERKKREAEEKLRRKGNVTNGTKSRKTDKPMQETLFALPDAH